MEIRAGEAADQAYVLRALTTAFHGPEVAVHDELIDASLLPSLIAWSSGAPAGLLTYRADSTGWEVVTLSADSPGQGTGRALLDRLRSAALADGAARIWLVTTNNNTGALRFYQRWGMDLVRVDRGAVDRARLLKPAIPVEIDGIRLSHELELELRLR